MNIQLSTLYPKMVYFAAIGAFIYAVFRSWKLAQIDSILLLTTPLALVPFCLFGTLFAIWNVNRYPVYAGAAVFLAVLSALMV